MPTFFAENEGFTCLYSLFMRYFMLWASFQTATSILPIFFLKNIPKQ